MFEALFTPIIYRKKKVKSFQDGFIKRINKKIILMDEGLCVIDSQFSSVILKEGVEIEFDQNYCLVGNQVQDTGSSSHESSNSSTANSTINSALGDSRRETTAPIMAKRRIGLKKSNVSICGKINPPIPSNKMRNDLVVGPVSNSLEPPFVKKSRLSIRDVQIFENRNANDQSDQESLHPNIHNIVRETEEPVTLKQKTDQDLLAFFLNEETEAENQETKENKAIVCNQTSIATKKDETVVPEDKDNELLAELEDMDPLGSYKIIEKEKTPIIPSSQSLSRNPLLSKFTRPIIMASSKNNQRVNSHHQLVNLQKELPSNPRKYPMRPNLFGLVFESEKKSDKYPTRLYREAIIPDLFQNSQEYKKKLEISITECMNLELTELCSKFQRVYQKNENEVRAQKIAFYTNATLKNSYGKSFSTTDRPNLLLSVENKEHHSAYSKDDIWIVSDNCSMKNPEFFRSFYYGVSGDAIELCPLSSSPHPCSQWLENNQKSLYAIRAFNAKSECMMLDMLGSDFFQETSLIKNILHRNQFSSEKNQQESNRIIPQNDVVDFTNLREEMIEKFNLNDDQAKVIRNFCDSLVGQNPCPIVLAHGVYGAGKSFLIAVLILILEKANKQRLFSQDHLQIVFASMTNVAVDRILLSLKELGFHDFIRVGSLKKIAKPILQYTASKSKSSDLKELNEMLLETENENEKHELEFAIKRFQQSNENANALLSETFLIGITCLAANFDVLEGISCPIVILDECSQMTEPMSLLPIVRFRVQYALLVGDPKQLAPTLSHALQSCLIKQKQSGLERTLFERLSDSQITKPILLSQQYRCHPQISMLSNRLFYKSQLKDGVGVAQKRGRLVATLGPLAFVRVDGQESKTSYGSFKNDMEITLITDIITSLINKGVEGAQIGVISLYKHQSELIASVLKSKGIERVQAATVDSFQGSEKEVILVSTVRSTTSLFLEDPRRINVALTRAKRHLIILACDGMANGSKLWRQIQVFCSDASPGIVSSRQFLSLLS